MRYGKTLNVMWLLSTSEIQRFYGGWVEGPVHREWSHLWRKEYRIETSDGVFIVLNRLKRRLNFRGLRELGIEFAPVHLYQSVLNFSFPARAHVITSTIILWVLL